jgi:hypothetical protein
MKIFILELDAILTKAEVVILIFRIDSTLISVLQLFFDIVKKFTIQQ